MIRAVALVAFLAALLTGTTGVAGASVPPPAAAARAAAAEATTLIADDFPDPSLVFDAGRWYAFGTNGDGGNVQVRVSSDQRSWETLPDALPRLPPWAEPHATWAPAAVNLGGRWHLYFAARHATTGQHCIGHGVASAVDGPYVDSAGQPFVCQLDQRGSIDPTVYVDNDGTPFLVYKSEGVAGRQPTIIWAQRLSADGSSTVGAEVEILRTDQAWEEPIIEGPAMTRLGGSLWLLYAANRWETGSYVIGAARCGSPIGPCTKMGAPLLTSGGHLEGPGSPDVTTGPDGRPQLTFAAWDAGRTGYPNGQRKVRALPIRVDSERLLVGNQQVPPVDSYRLVASDGGVFAFGRSAFLGSTGNLRLNSPIVDAAATPSNDGYWMVAADGGIFSFGDAAFHGSEGARRLNRPIVGMAPTPTGNGYWLVASDGGIFTHGDAPFLGSAGAIRLNRPIVAMAATPSGRGYWLVASDGGIFSYGDAPFFGSTGAMPLNQPIVDLVARPWATGYWLVAADGGLFAFGDAAFHGSAGGRSLDGPVDAALATPSGQGYRLATTGGAVAPFGDATDQGAVRVPLNAPIVGILP